MTTSSLPEERLGQLRVAKLRAILGDRLAGEVASSGPFATGAALLDDTGMASFLIEEAGPRSLGGALVWAVRQGATSVLLIVDAPAEVAGRLGREATYFDIGVSVERLVATSSEPVPPAPFDELPVAVDVPPDVQALLGAANVSVVTEHGVTRAEVHGLEVARVVESEGGVPVLEVGVGRFDREISSMMFSGVPTADALDNAVEMVSRYRAPGATIHPLRDLVPERWLRELVVAEPALVGASELSPVATTLAIDSLREAQPAAAVGTDLSGEPLVVVCTAGVDLDVVPLAADTRAFVAPDARLVICGPERNLLAPVRAVGERLHRPVEFVAVELPHTRSRS